MELKEMRIYLPFVSFHRNLSQIYTRVPRSSRVARVCLRTYVAYYVGQVPTYGSFCDTWRSHLNFPGESYVSWRPYSPSLFLSGNPPYFLPVQSLLFRLSRSLLSDLPLHPCRSTANHLAFSRAFARSFGRRVSAFGGDSGSFAALSSRVHVELSRLRSAETVLMDFEILLRLNYTHEIT